MSQHICPVTQTLHAIVLYYSTGIRRQLLENMADGSFPERFQILTTLTVSFDGVEQPNEYPNEYALELPDLFTSTSFRTAMGKTMVS